MTDSPDQLTLGIAQRGTLREALDWYCNRCTEGLSHAYVEKRRQEGRDARSDEIKLDGEFRMWSEYILRATMILSAPSESPAVAWLAPRGRAVIGGVGTFNTRSA